MGFRRIEKRSVWLRDFRIQVFISALEAKDLKLKFTEKEKNTHERRVNTMKTLLEVMVQTRRVQDLKILELEKELEDKNRVIMELKTSPPGIPQNNIPVSQIPLPTPESSPPRETMSLSTIQTLASRIENFRQMRQNVSLLIYFNPCQNTSFQGNAGSQSRPSRRSRPYWRINRFFSSFVDFSCCSYFCIFCCFANVLSFATKLIANGNSWWKI